MVMLLPEGVIRFISCIKAVTNPGFYVKGQAGDGREKALLQYVTENAKKGNPQSVLQSIDSYARRTWFMNVGSEKGLILENAIQTKNPIAVLELGAYCGYSAIRIASQLKQLPGSKLVSLELSPQNAAIARSMIDFAGLSSVVEVVEGTVSTRIDYLRRILEDLGTEHFEVVFIDHDKNAYLSDMLRLKESGLIRKGAVLVADNMGIPGAPEYYKYLKTHPEEFQTVEHKCGLEYLTWLPDRVTVSTFLA